jgi:hypothetical protein
MPGLTLTPQGSFAADLGEAAKSVDKAVTAALKQCAETALSLGRANIAGAGNFGPKWQQALKANVGKTSIFVHQDIPYSSIFEEGGTISGRPLLWLPLPSTPQTIGGQRTTAKLWAARVGKLTMLKGPGGKPILAGKAPGSERLVPLFVGVDAVTIPKKFDIEGACRSAAAELPGLYDAARA